MPNEHLTRDPIDLMRRAKEGDAEAFGILYEEYFTPVFRYIYFRVSDKSRAEDLAQTTFIKVFQSLKSYTERANSPLAYFFTIAKNLTIDEARKKKPATFGEETFSDIPDTSRGAEDSAKKREIQELIRHSLLILSDDQREVITLKFVNEFSNSEVANLLGKTEEAVRQLQSRGLKILRKKLEAKI